MSGGGGEKVKQSVVREERGEKVKQLVVRKERGVGEKGKLSLVQKHQGKALKIQKIAPVEKMRRMAQEKNAYYKRYMATDMAATLLPEEYAPSFPGGLEAIRMINQNALELHNCARPILEQHEANGYMEYPDRSPPAHFFKLIAEGK